MSIDMVLVPREPTDEMIVAFAETWYSKRQCIDDPDMLDAYAAMLAVAPECQGEPVALPERLPVHRASAYGWNACLDEIAKLGPLYSRADPDEVERLSRKAANADLALAAQTRQVHALRAQLAEAREDRNKLGDRYDVAEAKLAERDELLRDTKTMLASELSYELFTKMATHVKRIDAALSASAEPVAKCRCNMRTKLVGDGCSVCNPERVADLQEPSTPICKTCKGSGLEYDSGAAHACTDCKP